MNYDNYGRTGIIRCLELLRFSIFFAILFWAVFACSCFEEESLPLYESSLPFTIRPLTDLNQQETPLEGVFEQDPSCGGRCIGILKKESYSSKYALLVNTTVQYLGFSHLVPTTFLIAGQNSEFCVMESLVPSVAINASLKETPLPDEVSDLIKQVTKSHGSFSLFHLSEYLQNDKVDVSIKEKTIQTFSTRLSKDNIHEMYFLYLFLGAGDATSRNTMVSWDGSGFQLRMIDFEDIFCTKPTQRQTCMFGLPPIDEPMSESLRQQIASIPTDNFQSLLPKFQACYGELRGKDALEATQQRIVSAQELLREYPQILLRDLEIFVWANNPEFFHQRISSLSFGGWGYLRDPIYNQTPFRAVLRNLPLFHMSLKNGTEDPACDEYALVKISHRLTSSNSASGFLERFEGGREKLMKDLKQYIDTSRPSSEGVVDIFFKREASRI